MQLTSKSTLLIYLILALFLFSVLWEFYSYEPKVRTELKIEVHEKIVERTKVKRELVMKQLNHFDTIYLDTFKSTSEGLKNAIQLHIHLDSIL